jgi:hypothetical protein
MWGPEADFWKCQEQVVGLQKNETEKPMFLETTPDTSGYMIAGYAIAFLVMGLYVFSIYLRYRNLNRDLETLEVISNESKPKPALSRAETSRPKAKKPKTSVKKKK